MLDLPPLREDGNKIP